MKNYILPTNYIINNTTYQSINYMYQRTQTDLRSVY